MAKSKNDPNRDDAEKQDETQATPADKAEPQTDTETATGDAPGPWGKDDTAGDAPADSYGLTPRDDGTHPAAESPDGHSEDGPPGDLEKDVPVDEYGITPPDGSDANDRAEGPETVGADTLSASDDTPLATAGDDSLPPEATPAAALGTPPEPVRETVVKHRGGFVPMVLGGIVAAALGFAAAQYGEGRLPFMPAPEPDPFIAETEARLTQQDEQVSGLDARLQETQAALDRIDVDTVAGAVEALVPQVETLAQGQQSLTDRLDTLETRMTELEKQPMEQAVSPEAIAAYERELASLRESLDAQRTEVEQSRAEIEAIAETARQSEQSAARQAQLAEQRATLAELTAALQSGQSYEEPLSELRDSGVTVPEPLAQVDEAGIPTPAQLAAEYPDAARDALRAARLEEESGGGVGAFFRTQLGARSVTPQEGDDADAILSRAEAAVQRGNLEQALDEIATLPEAAQAEMADWVEMARVRLEALNAVSGLASELNE
ncbi:COG4223 family protein [Citreimonas sp.]|uniref:COG4223 family protein n=1 Tax=Citreimonas sp. TaxID=3036715 RepID=UPI0035C80362